MLKIMGLQENAKHKNNENRKHSLGWLQSKKKKKKTQKITVVTEDMKRWELPVGMYSGAATVDNCVAISQKKIKNGTIIQSSIPLLGIQKNQEKWPRG